MLIIYLSSRIRAKIHMSVNLKLVIVIAIVAVVCIAAAAFVMTGNNSKESTLSGNWVEYEVEGDREAGMGSYAFEGKSKLTFGYHSGSDHRYQMMEAGSVIRDYKEMSKELVSPILDMYWMSEQSGMEKIGKETIQTSAGEKECDILKEAVGSGETRTYWVADGWIPYRIVHEAGTDAVGTTLYKATYTFMNKGFTEQKSGCVLTVVKGDGVDVEGNIGSYALGGKAKLTAKYGEEKGFGGWLDEKFNLITISPTLELELTRDTTVYAVNGLGWDKELEPGTETDLKRLFGNAGSFLIENESMGTSETSSDGKYVFPEAGTYKIVASDNDVPKYVRWVLVNGSVEREFKWDYDGVDYSLKMEIDYSDLQYVRDYYTLEERRADWSDHVRDRTFVTLSYTDPRMAPYLDGLVDGLISLYKEEYGEPEEYSFLNFALNFTQCIRYQEDSDIGYIEYWKFPLETLYDNAGDCEDTSILFAAIAHQACSELGYKTRIALQLMPQHAGGAVTLVNPTGHERNPEGFIFAETTSNEYYLGDIPNKEKDYFLNKKYYPSVSVTIDIQ